MGVSNGSFIAARRKILSVRKVPFSLDSDEQTALGGFTQGSLQQSFDHTIIDTWPCLDRFQTW
jgi:hypothetical protein